MKQTKHVKKNVLAGISVFAAALAVFLFMNAPAVNAEVAPMDYTQWHDTFAAFQRFENMNPDASLSKNTWMNFYLTETGMDITNSTDASSTMSSQMSSHLYGVVLPGLDVSVACAEDGRTAVMLENTGTQDIYLRPTEHPESGLVLHDLRSNDDSSAPQVSFEELMGQAVLQPGRRVTGLTSIDENLVFDSVQYSNGNPMSWDQTELSCV